MRKLAIASFSFFVAAFLAVNVISHSLILYFSAGLLVISPACLFFRGRPRLTSAIVLISLAVGFAWSYLYIQTRFVPAASYDTKTEHVSARVVSDPIPTDYGSKAAVKIDTGTGREIKTLLYINKNSIPVSTGDEIEFTAKFSLSDHVHGEKTNYYTADGIFLRATLSGDIEVTGHKSSPLSALPRMAKAFSDKISEAFGPKYSPFLRAFLINDHEALNEDGALVGALSSSGVSHIVAISGMHIAFLAGFLNAVIRRKRLLAAICIPVLFLFSAMVEFTPSVTRAAVMQSLLMLAPLLKRENDAVTSLSFSLLLLTAINPFAVNSVGMQLSFASTLGIVLFTPGINLAVQSRLVDKPVYQKRLPRGAIIFLSGSISSSIGALAFTIPLTAIHFGTVSLVAPVANLLTLWPVSVLFCSSLIVALMGFVYLPLSVFFAGAVSFIVRYITAVVSFLAQLPFSSFYISNTYFLIWLCYIYVTVVVFITLKAKLRQLIFPVCAAVISLCCIVVFTVASGARSDFSVTALDVGQGQSIVVLSDGFSAVIDCGSSSGEKAGAAAHEFLSGNGVTVLDALILTHFHSDHANGVEELIGKIKVSTLFIPDPDIESGYIAEDIIELARRRRIDIMYITELYTVESGGLVLTLFPPMGGSDENEQGLSILCTMDGFDALITGDMDAKNERKLMNFASFPAVELLIVGHHGSKYSTSIELLERLTPEIAVISVGRNSYGHPAPETLERLYGMGIAVYRTDMLGNVTVSPGRMQSNGS